jgi:alpha-beta hydrolase superfamily lysophospholipase
MIVYLKVLIAALRLMKMTGPIKAELKVVEVARRDDHTVIYVPGKLESQTLGPQSLFWNSRAGHAEVQVATDMSAEGKIALRVVRLFKGSLPSPRDYVSLSGWLGEHPKHFGFGQEHEEVLMPNKTKAWFFSGQSTKWVIHVHGRRAGMGETLRNVSQFSDLGFNQLTISMESDPKPYGHGSKRSRLGFTEWREIETAVLYAKSQGATEILMFGWSQGSFMIGQFLRSSEHTSLVKGAIMDSPLLDYRSTMRFHAARQGIDTALGDRVIDSIQKDLAVRLFGYRNIDVDRMSLAKNQLRTKVPVLILYSRKDGHVETMDVFDFERINPDVTLVEIVGAKHCRLYNHDKEKYQQSIKEWLQQHQI